MKLIITLSILFSVPALATNYISSIYNGLQLANENGVARISAWSPENKLELTATGQIKMKDVCLHSKGMGYATWRPCKEDSIGQVWTLANDLLKNKEGFCAEVESYPNTVLNARMIVKVCRDGKVEQKWRSHE